MVGYIFCLREIHFLRMASLWKVSMQLKEFLQRRFVKDVGLEHFYECLIYSVPLTDQESS